MPISITKARDFSRDADYLAFSVVRLRNAHLKGLGGRHSWVRIENTGNGKVLYRRVRGAGASAGASTGLPANAIEIDYDSRLELGIEGPRDATHFHDCSLTVGPASRLGELKAHWRHPNIEYRVPYRLAILSLALGLLGALLGALSLVR
ncbi:hypothetical protein [Stenotrophomonas mori]|uniref:Uncharacterized protein n=1 Tax=Stenotrophomonas mori TaxID=2871096 RepID=A0ABT0SKF8_9GAMM|nr:hypothetical protein [Stenotrophomonas mori]MCL7715801.1 hypothetical protein [Stenotrophomonas mori]